MTDIHRELEAIRRRNKQGLLVPSEVVEAARDPNNPLHNSFEWEDTVAAEQYRLWQARKLIVAVRMQPVEDRATVQAYVSLPSDRIEGGYRGIVEVLSDAQRRDELWAMLEQEIERLKTKYGELEGVAEGLEALAAKRPRPKRPPKGSGAAAPAG